MWKMLRFEREYRDTPAVDEDGELVYPDFKTLPSNS
jgi:hypothetical protein